MSWDPELSKDELEIIKEYREFIRNRETLKIDEFVKNYPDHFEDLLEIENAWQNFRHAVGLKSELPRSFKHSSGQKHSTDQHNPK